MPGEQKASLLLLESETARGAAQELFLLGWRIWEQGAGGEGPGFCP